MIKKITLILVLSYLVFSCGKKGDPKYQGTYLKNDFQNFVIIKI